MKRTKIMSIFLLAFLPVLALGGEAKTEAGQEIVVSGKSDASQWDPAAAFDGPSSPGGSAAASKGNYLVVWSDGAGTWGGDADIHGARLKSDGSVVDTTPIVISKAKDFQKRPRVAWTGSEWLVVWQDWRGGKSYDVYAARVSGDGKVLDPDGIAVCIEKGDQVMPAVASDGAGGSLVVWADYRAGHYDIWGAPVKDGRAGASAPVIAAPGEQMSPSIAWTGRHYLVACANGNNQVHQKRVMSLPIIRVGTDGKALDPQFTILGYGMPGIPAFDSAMAAASGHALLMGRHTSGKTYSPNFVYGVFLDAEGKSAAHDNPGRPGLKFETQGISSPPPIAMTEESGAQDVFCPAVAGSSDWFLALHQEAAPAGDARHKQNTRPIIRYQLIDAKTGRVVEDGRYSPAGAREKAPNAAGGPAGEFLLVYERNDAKEANQRVCARVVKTKLQSAMPILNDSGAGNDGAK